MRKGVSPIVGAMLLILIIMGVATSTTYFIRTQQERVAGRLSGAFGDKPDSSHAMKRTITAINAI